jgi:hypothetical protein
MSVLHLVLTTKWYNLIESGEKTSEYRANSLYWQERILRKWNQSHDLCIIFHKGYTLTTMFFKVKNIIVANEQIELQLGERLK